MDERVLSRLRNYTIGGAVERARTRQGVPDYQFARKLRVTTQTLRDNESGDEAIPAPKLYEIAHLLGVPVEDLFEHFANAMSELAE